MKLTITNRSVYFALAAISAGGIVRTLKGSNSFAVAPGDTVIATFNTDVKKDHTFASILDGETEVAKLTLPARKLQVKHVVTKPAAVEVVEEAVVDAPVAPVTEVETQEAEVVETAPPAEEQSPPAEEQPVDETNS